MRCTPCSICRLHREARLSHFCLRARGQISRHERLRRGRKWRFTQWSDVTTQVQVHRVEQNPHGQAPRAAYDMWCPEPPAPAWAQSVPGAAAAAAVRHQVTGTGAAWRSACSDVCCMCDTCALECTQGMTDESASIPANQGAPLMCSARWLRKRQQRRAPRLVSTPQSSSAVSAAALRRRAGSFAGDASPSAPAACASGTAPPAGRTLSGRGLTRVYECACKRADAPPHHRLRHRVAHEVDMRTARPRPCVCMHGARRHHTQSECVAPRGAASAARPHRVAP